MNINGIDKKWNSVEFKVHGRYALFSDPVTRPGGEKFSYPVPTYQALKGILESVYWKPTIIWHIDAVRVIKKIQTESKGIRTIKLNSSGQDLSFYTYLKDVEYQVIGHFEWNENRPELSYDRNENKHHNIAKRSIEQGGRRDVFLGTSECSAYVEPCEFGSGCSFYDNYGEMHLGVMFHGFDYPDETGIKSLGIRLTRPVMKDGVIIFDKPKEIDKSMKRVILQYGQKYHFKKFESGVNFSSVDA
ncbi:MAG: type I-C CRISPR-associated protein Cas5c [Defluviitaleaceae bacterium]|nr:type I-C CRISPR-associated protein Cas5c [Defluviitaleaceae bacterium]